MSLRAVLTNFYLRRKMKSKPLHLLDPAELRAEADAVAPQKIPPSIRAEDVDDDGVRGQWHRPTKGAATASVLYAHGGGYVFGSVKSHRAVTFALAERTPADVFSLEYRLAPEHPFPAAVDDALAAYEWLLAGRVDPAKLVLAGDSAGGGLSLALAYCIKARGLPMPAGILLYSPWTDLAVTGRSIDENEKTDAMFKAEHVREGVAKVLAGADPRAPLASPLYGDPAGLPPTLSFVSDHEVLRDDGVRMHDRMKAAGVDSEIVLAARLTHVWPVFVGKFPEADAAIEKSAAFIRRRTGAQP